MSYATIDMMKRLFGEDELILATVGRGGSLTDEEAVRKLEAAIEAADAEVNGYMQGVVPLPLARVPEALRLHASNIARYYLTGNPTEAHQARYKNAIRYLERVQDGKAGLGLDDAGEDVPTEGGVDFKGSTPADRRYYRD